MTVRRSNGEGSIYQNDRGYWCASVSYEDAETGERKRRVLYSKTKTEVTHKLKEARRRADAGAPIKDSARTVGGWIAEWRVGPLAASSRAASTKTLYEVLCKTHLEPAPFGAVTLDKLRPSHVDKLLLTLRAKKLNESTIRLIFTTLRLALDDAVRDGLLAQNPAQKVKRPKAPHREARFLTTDEVARLLDAARGTRYHPLLVFIASTGVRKGEALGTRWSDIDLDAATYRVNGTKTDSSRRTLALSPALVQLLKVRRRQQKEERLRAGSLWTDTGLVWTTQTGRAVGARDVLKVIGIAAEAAGLDGVTVHCLRHSAATAWLERGVPIKAVSELLGHKDASVTATIYAHTTEQTKRDAMDVLSDAIGL